MKTIHQLIGKFMLRYWLVRYRRQIQAAAGVGAVLLAAAGYLIATRQPPEGYARGLQGPLQQGGLQPRARRWSLMHS